MFFVGENDRRFHDDFRPELHDSDGLLMHTGAGEWIWRPLRNPREISISSFVDNNPRGFGLMQRDRTFEHYQDLDLGYEVRPSYWVEPRGDWGEGRIELVEIPTGDETNDNIVALLDAQGRARARPEPRLGLPHDRRDEGLRAASGRRGLQHLADQPRALGSSEPRTPGTRRFIIDFAGGDLDYYLKRSREGADRAVHLQRPHPAHLPGAEPEDRGLPRRHRRRGRTRASRRTCAPSSRRGNRALTETWTFPWKAE